MPMKNYQQLEDEMIAEFENALPIIQINNGVDYPYNWPRGHYVISRKPFNVFKPTDTSSIESLESRVKELEEWRQTLSKTT